MSHDELTRQVAELFRKEGFVCNEEFTCREARGRIDIVCSKGGEVVLVECKGFSPADMQLVDLVQLAEYYSCISSSPIGRGKRIRAFLAYKSRFHDGIFLAELKVGMLKSFEPTNLQVIFEDAGSMVVGYYCRFCSNDRCIVHAR